MGKLWAYYMRTNSVPWLHCGVIDRCCEDEVYEPNEDIVRTMPEQVSLYTYGIATIEPYTNIAPSHNMGKIAGNRPLRRNYADKNERNFLCNQSMGELYPP